jgi:hypothetical protein
MSHFGIDKELDPELAQRIDINDIENADIDPKLKNLLM